MTAYGRVHLGVAAATVSRYTALMMPGVAAVVLLFMRYRHRMAPVQLIALLLFTVCVVPETRQAWLQSRYCAAMKLCCLKHDRPARDFDATNERVKTRDSFKTFQEVCMREPDAWQMLAEQGSVPFVAGGAEAPRS